VIAIQAATIKTSAFTSGIVLILVPLLSLLVCQ
jgi:hypothetical protein